MSSHPSTQSELREKLIRSIWLLGDKYPYSFAPDGSCQIINHSRSGNYTISPDCRSVFLTWTTPSYTEELRVLEDGNLFMSGGILVAVDKSGDRYFPCYPLPQPDVYARFEIDTGKMPNYGNITLEGLQVRLISTDFGENFLSEDVREFGSQEEAEEYYYSTITSNDPYYSPHSIGEPVYMELSNDKSHKFYEVTVEGFTLKICYGRIGSSGKTDHTTYKTPRQVQAAAVKKINEKLKKGYVILPQPGQHPSQTTKSSSQPDSIPYWLPEDFRVFTNDMDMVGIDSNGAQGVEERILPTVNQYTGVDGGYVAFYSRNPAKAVYSVGGGIYVVGQIRLKGRYIGGIFHPAGYKNQDISAAPEFKELCRQTFGVEGWAGGDTEGWFAEVDYCPEAIQRNDIVQKIPYSTTPGLLLTVKPEDIIWWNIVKFRPGSTVEIVAISLGSCFSFNLMAGENFAYHFNPRSHEGQIVQNTKVGNWGQEERLPFPQEMASGKKFTVKIVVQETQLAVYLNDTFLSHYRHRIPPAEIDSLRLICTQGSLQIFSVNIS
jgi:predicted DNA-binding WGR domain protein